MSEERKQGEAGPTEAAQDAGFGATGIFGVVPAAPASTERGFPEAAASQPVVHTVVFKPDFSRVEQTDELLNLLRSPSAPVAEARPMAPAPLATGSATGGFTQLLRTLNHEQLKDQQQVKNQDQMKEPVLPERPVAAQPVAAAQVTSFPTKEAEPLPTPAGSFTQLFQSLSTPHQEAAPAEPLQKIIVPGGSGVSTAHFLTVTSTSVEQPGDGSPSGSVPPAESFTQLFQATNGPSIPLAATQEATMPEAARLHESVPPEPPKPASFTEVFRTLDATPAVPEHHTPEANASSGSFTQMFRALETPVAKTRPVEHRPAGEQSSFTQMFSSSHAAPTEPAVTSQSSGASQVFATYRPEQAEARIEPPAFSPVVRSLPVTPFATQAPEATSGGLTQLLRALDQPGQVTARLYDKPASLPSSFAEGIAPSVGATQPFHTPPLARGAEPPLSAGPSEFTRILQASQSREAALHGAAGVQLPAQVPQGSAAARAPTLPQASSLPQAPPWTLPQLPSTIPLPEVKPPEAPKPAAGMQQYVPLLLIVVIFLLLAILVAVIFLMKR